MGSLRHVMLREAGAPIRQNDLVASIILETGTLWHRRVGEILVGTGAMFMQEVRMDRWLPKGWGGTADWIFWHPEYEGFVLGDLKTTAGEGIAHIEREGIKREHHHQLSAYWHALVDAGLPMVKGLGVLYLPKNRAKNYKTEPILVEADPLPKEYMLELMSDRRERVDSYLRTMQDDLMTVSQRKSLKDNGLSEYSDADVFVTPELVDPIGRVQKAVWNSGAWDIKLVPHWSAQFCPYDNDLCDCNTTGETKIGAYSASTDEMFYTARKGYEDIEPIELTTSQRRRLANG